MPVSGQQIAVMGESNQPAGGSGPTITSESATIRRRFWSPPRATDGHQHSLLSGKVGSGPLYITLQYTLRLSRSRGGSPFRTSRFPRTLPCSKLCTAVSTLAGHSSMTTPCHTSEIRAPTVRETRPRAPSSTKPATFWDGPREPAHSRRSAMRHWLAPCSRRSHATPADISGRLSTAGTVPTNLPGSLTTSVLPPGSTPTAPDSDLSCICTLHFATA